MIPHDSIRFQLIQLPAHRCEALLQALLEEDQVTLGIPVRVEVFSRCPPRDWRRLCRSLEALLLLIPSDSTWERMEEWLGKAMRKG